MAFQDADDASNTNMNWQLDSNGVLVNYGSPLESEPQASYPLSPSILSMLAANDFNQEYELAFEVEQGDFSRGDFSIQSFYPFMPNPMSPIPLSPRTGTGHVEPMMQEIESTSPTTPPAQPSRSSPNQQSRQAIAAARNENKVVKRRLPRIDRGYSCAQTGCGKVFDTQGAATKHFQRAHTLEADRPVQCPHCARRFLWEKDVRRHISQMHADLQTAVALRSPNLRRPSMNLEMLFGIGGPRVSAEAIFAALRAAIQMKRVAIRIRARRRSQSDASAPKYIMVTRNHLDFRAIDISGSRNAMALRSTIRQGLEVLPPDNFSLAPYVLGTGFIENCLDPIQLYNTVTNAPAGRGPLHFFLR